MTTIKYYDADELQEIIEGIAIEELALGNSRWENQTKAITSTSVPRIELERGLTNCAVYRDRINLFYEKAHEKGVSKDHANVFMRATALMYTLNDDEERATIEYARKLFKKEKNIYNTRTYLEFPLDKRINALYDDLTVFILYYDNIGALGNNRCAVVRSFNGDKRALEHFAEYTWSDEKRRQAFLALTNDEDRCRFIQEEFGMDYVEKLESLETAQEKIEFVKNNVEFTHLALGPVESPSWGIVLYGENTGKLQTNGSTQMVLPREFADFKNLTLTKTMEIRNNDLMQRLQTKIDIDKENLEVLDTKYVGEDEYKILKAPEGNRVSYFIRYVCPSTGRVYFNDIDERSLSESEKYYRRGDVTSFIYAWWHINNCGEDPINEDGSPIDNVVRF